MQPLNSSIYMGPRWTSAHTSMGRIQGDIIGNRTQYSHVHGVGKEDPSMHWDGDIKNKKLKNSSYDDSNVKSYPPLDH